MSRETMKHMDRARAAANHESVKDPKVAERVNAAHAEASAALEKGDSKGADKAISKGMHEHNPDSVQEHLRNALDAHREQGEEKDPKLDAWARDRMGRFASK